MYGQHTYVTLFRDFDGAVWEQLARRYCLRGAPWRACSCLVDLVTTVDGSCTPYCIRLCDSVEIEFSYVTSPGISSSTIM